MRRMVIGLCLIVLCACEQGPQTYKLYRSSSADPDMRIHVATFDANYDDSASSKFPYNLENCQIARDLFQSQESVKVNYWCE
jgi:hypothetical protein